MVVAGETGSLFRNPISPMGPDALRLIRYAIAGLENWVAGVVVIAPVGTGADAESLAADLSVDILVEGGGSRSASVRAGLASLPATATHVLIHDATHPLVPGPVVGRVIEALQAGSVAVVPVVPVTDTLRSVGGGTVDRSGLVRVQTPQGFELSALQTAHDLQIEGTDEASVVEAVGVAVDHVDGETARDEHEQATNWVAEWEGPGGGMSGPAAIRIGQGFDVHPWSDDSSRSLVLGGVEVPDERALAGHSDADVVAHACTDALLGAAGLGDIGQLFPDTDPNLDGADSLDLLAKAVSEVRQAGWAVTNVDCTLVLDRPKIAPLRSEMERRLGDVVGAPVTVKGKRTEGLASLGQGAHCWAVAILHAVDPGAGAT